MFRFSCFHSPNHSLKPKKTVQLPTESMGKSLEDHNENKPNKDHVFSNDVHQDNNANPFPSSPDQDWNSEGLKSMNDIDSEHGNEIKTMRKCVSLGADLAAYHEVTSGEDTSSFYGNRSGDEYHKTQTSISPQISSNFVKHTSDMSPDAEVVDDCFEMQLSGVCTPWTPHAFVKSNSMPYMHLACTDVVHEYGSSNDSKDKSIDNDSVGHADKSDGDEAYDCVGLSKDWIVPATDERDKGKTVQEEYFAEDLPNENFKIKRIENWVMDLQHSSSPEEAIMLTDLEHHGQNGKTTILDPMTPSRNDVKAISGIDAAKLYISSLNSAATTAQLANHGLIVIPFLNTFSNLKALNLSGNSIVRITVGALPRGLHILNLSKNSISIIEGLRDLTRLRVLDLSYNRILRIGHGLASCSSLKELYLAGNKISEVEGLHRLLKLNVLDLRFNKLSTTKSLGQLAANYGSLQAISLEGNPAQKNIGDEQLKKFLISLVPHIAYINRKSIKGGGIKESADRAARIGIYAHQCDRGLRSESKRSRYGRKSQVVGGRGRSMRLPPSGVKAVSDRHQFPDVSSQVVSFRPDLAMRRAYSEELLRTV